MLDLLTVGTEHTRTASYAADDTHRPPLHGFAATARAVYETDGWTDTAPGYRVNTLTGLIPGARIARATDRR